jgi:hypothetical protein
MKQPAIEMHINILARMRVRIQKGLVILTALGT